MGEPLTRGYLIERVFSFIDSHYDAESAQTILTSIPNEHADLRPHLKGAEWYSRAHLVEILRAIVRFSSDEETAYRDLKECGRFMSNEATNTYLKLLLKILTPALFAKKIPSFWERDNRDGGNFDPKETKVSDGHMRLKMVGVEGFDHVAPVSAGFCSFVLNAMGKKNIDVQQNGWSLATPCPESYVLELTWS
jgi:hypothetical protein